MGLLSGIGWKKIRRQAKRRILEHHERIYTYIYTYQVHDFSEGKIGR